MEKILLSVKGLDALNGKRQPTAHRKWNGDGSGFGVKVSIAGTLTFFQFYRSPVGTVDAKGHDITGKRRFFTLGTYSPSYPLKQARRDAEKVRAQVRAGIDPQEQARIDTERTTREKKQEAQRGTLAGVLALYLRHLRRNNRAKRYITDIVRAWYRDVWPVVPKSTKAAEVTAQDIRHIIHRPLSRGSDHSARALRANLHKAFQLAIRADNDPRNLKSKVLFSLSANPVADIPVEAKITPGNCALSFEEIGKVWNAAPHSVSHPSDALLIRLLLAFGGQHITELREATWDEFDLTAGRWDMKAARHKNRKRDHLLPINSTATALLAELRNITGVGYLFPQLRRDSKPMRIERPGHIVAAITKWLEHNDQPVQKFTAADFRRTCKTRMHEIGIPKSTTNQLHNHDFSGVSATHYDRWDYFAEKQRAMAAWEIALKAAIDGQPVPMARCRRALRWENEGGSTVSDLTEKQA